MSSHIYEFDICGLNHLVTKNLNQVLVDQEEGSVQFLSVASPAAILTVTEDTKLVSYINYKKKLWHIKATISLETDRFWKAELSEAGADQTPEEPGEDSGVPPAVGEPQSGNFCVSWRGPRWSYIKELGQLQSNGPVPELIVPHPAASVTFVSHLNRFLSQTCRTRFCYQLEDLCFCRFTALVLLRLTYEESCSHQDPVPNVCFSADLQTRYFIFLDLSQVQDKGLNVSMRQIRRSEPVSLSERLRSSEPAWVSSGRRRSQNSVWHPLPADIMIFQNEPPQIHVCLQNQSLHWRSKREQHQAKAETILKVPGSVSRLKRRWAVIIPHDLKSGMLKSQESRLIATFKLDQWASSWKPQIEDKHQQTGQIFRLRLQGSEIQEWC